MADLTDLAVIKEVLTRHGFTFSKALGQNFLVNPAICPQMAAACGADENTGVLEIGPGPGVLTKELAQKAKKVVSVELDTRLLPVLSETLQAFDNVTIVNDDILKADLPALFRQQFDGMRVVVRGSASIFTIDYVINNIFNSNSSLYSCSYIFTVFICCRYQGFFSVYIFHDHLVFHLHHIFIK